MTRLVAVIKGPTLALAKEQIAAAQALADLIEIRLDLFEPKALGQLKELPRSRPLLFTLRKKSQGGAFEQDEPARLALFEKCLAAAEPDYCDIETDTELDFFERMAKKYPKMKIIGSFHDFEKMPEHLQELFERMHKPHISHYKLAIKANSVNDTLRLMFFSKDHQNLTCIAMGPEGQASRILSPLDGSELCYAAVHEEDAVLGQLSLKTLCETYRFKSLTPETKIYALLGDPVDKSVGHIFHNKSFPKNAVYVKLHTAIPDLPLFFSIMRKFPFGGFSVTMPLKEQLEKFMTQIDPTAKAIGSINTIKVEDGHLIGYNTDGEGAMNALEKHRKVKGLRVAVLGAGGSARAIAYAAIQRGAKVTVLNRTIERAKALAAEFGCEAGALDEVAVLPYDILINSIPVDLLFSPDALHPSTLVMDIVYWEKETPLLKAAKARGCVCVGGMEMFEEQALLQQQIWFGKKK